MKKLAITLFLALGAMSLQAHALNGTWDLVSTGTPHGDMHYQVTFAHGAGTLEGFLSSEQGDLTFTGARAKR